MAAATNGSMSKDSSVPKLESRREHETPQETIATRARAEIRRGEEHELSKAERPGIAVYLIEREAIRLRRLRWTASTDSSESSSLHFEPGEARPEPSFSEEPVDASLENYARPRAPDSRSPTKKGLIERARDRLRQIFLGEQPWQ